MQNLRACFFPPDWEQVEEDMKQITDQKLDLARIFSKTYFQLKTSNFLDQKLLT